MGVGTADQFFEVRALGAVAYEEDFEILALLSQGLSSFEQDGDSLFGDESADVTEADDFGFFDCWGSWRLRWLGRIGFQAVIDDGGSRKRDSFCDVVRDGHVGGGACCQKVAREGEKDRCCGTEPGQVLRLA